MKIALLIGSIRLGRQSQKIGYYLEQRLQQQGVQTDLIDLAQHPLPLLEERVGFHPALPREVGELSQRLDAADGLVLITPEYHGSFSGVLKNALDYFWKEFQKKPIGVVAVSAGKMGGINASTQLQHVILSLGAYALPTKLLVPEVQQAFDDKGNPVAEQLTTATNRFVSEYLWLAQAIYRQKSFSAQPSSIAA